MIGHFKTKQASYKENNSVILNADRHAVDCNIAQEFLSDIFSFLPHDVIIHMKHSIVGASEDSSIKSYGETYVNCLNLDLFMLHVAQEWERHTEPIWKKARDVFEAANVANTSSAMTFEDFEYVIKYVHGIASQM